MYSKMMLAATLASSSYFVSCNDQERLDAQVSEAHSDGSN